MPFPVSITGRFYVARGDRADDVRAQVIKEASELLGKRSDDVEIEQCTVVSRPSFIAWFTAPGSNWHPMVPFDVVRLTVSGSESEAIVDYDLSTRRMLWIVSAMATAVALFVLITSIGNEGMRAAADTAAKLAALAFGWLFGMNFLFGWLRGPRWLRRNLRSRLSGP